MFGAVYFGLKQRLILSTLFIAIASFNNETFFLVPIALFFLHDKNAGVRKRIMWLAIQVRCCLVSSNIIMSVYENNAGDIVQHHLLDNLKFWFRPGSFPAITLMALGAARRFSMILEPAHKEPVVRS